MASSSQIQNESSVDYGRRFGELLEKYIRHLYQELDCGKQWRTWAHAPFCFNEDHLRDYINWHEPACDGETALWIELDALGDVIKLRKGRGIDYAYIQHSLDLELPCREKREKREKKDKRPALQGVKATLEVKGPTRPIFWDKGGNFLQTKNGKSGVRQDIKKQLARSLQAKETQHYVAWLLTPPSSPAISSDLNRLLQKATDGIEARLTEHYRSEMADVEGLLLLVYRVTPKEATKDTIAP